MGGDGDSKPSAGHKTEKSLNYDAVQTTGKTEKSLAVQMAEKPVNYATKSDSTNAKEAARGADQEDQPSDEHGPVHDGGISGSSWPFGHLAMLCEEDETDVSLQCFIPCTMQLCDSKGCRDICASEYNMCTALNEFMDNLLNSDSQPPTAPKKGGSSTFLADRAAAMQAMDEKLQEASTQILDSGADIHYLTLADARKHLANQRSTTMRVLGVSGTSDVADFEGDLAMLVEVNGVKVRLPLGVGYASSKVPKSLISAWRLLREVGGELHFERDRSYYKPRPDAEPIMLIQRRGLYYLHMDADAEQSC